MSRAGLEQALAVLGDVYPWDTEPAVAQADAGGRVVAVAGASQGPSLQSTIEHVHRALTDLAAGDLVVSNDPASGCADVTQMTLVRLAGSGAAAARLRIPDIGGFELGGLAPESYDIWGEGARFPALRIARAGTVLAQSRGLVLLNSRTPGLVDRALAALERAAALLVETLPEPAAATVEWEADRAAAHRALGTLRPGAYAAEAAIAVDGRFPAPVVRGALDVAQDGVALRFDDSDPEVDAPLNCSPGHTADCCTAELAARLDGFPATPAALSVVRLQPGSGTVTGAGPRAQTGLAAGHGARAVRDVVSRLLDQAGAPPRAEGWWQAEGESRLWARVDAETLRLRADRAQAICDLEATIGAPL